MEVTLLGMLILVNEEQHENTLSLMEVILLGILILVTKEQPSNA